ncbi:MAG: lamin tail domain-containing protein [Candidatus Acetothermia bacterium]
MQKLHNSSALIFMVFAYLTFLVAIGTGGLAQTDNSNVIMTPINYDAADQVLTLLNKSSEEVDLSGYQIRDGAGNVFKLPEDEGEASKLAPFAILRIHTGPEARQSYEGEKDLFWTNKNLWNNEKTPQLVSPEGKVVYELDLSEIKDSARLASCLTRKGVILYSLKACSHCQTQKDEFGSAIEFINYVECSKNRKICSNAGISTVPAWYFGRQDRWEIGAKSLNELSSLANCSYGE